MAHLACVAHAKRVLVTDNAQVHRSNGEPCGSINLRIGVETVTCDDARKHFENIRPA
jgi:hypothetical protein